MAVDMIPRNLEHMNKIIKSMKVLRFEEYIKESLPQQKSIDQLNMVRKLSKNTDIGDRIPDMTGADNLISISNPIDTGIESYTDYMKTAKIIHPIL
jgi:hypothetical protein